MNISRASIFNAGRVMRDSLRELSADALLRPPVYDAWRYLRNTEARSLYEREKPNLEPTQVERAVVSQLRTDGIAVLQLEDLLPGRFAALRGWADDLLREPQTKQRIDRIVAGDRPADAKAGKYYIVRPLGDRPALSLDDHAVKLALDDSVLRIVSDYLGMLARISAIDLWYNIATQGPGVYSQRWHRDPEDRAIVKTFLYLHDCEEDNGPFCYIPGTQFARLEAGHIIGRDNYPGDEAVESQFAGPLRRSYTGSAGTLILCDTTGFHKGGGTQVGTRYVLNTVYTTNGSEPIARGWRNCDVAGTAELTPPARYALGFLRGESHGLPSILGSAWSRS